MANTAIIKIIEGFADALDVLDKATTDTLASATLAGSATLLRGVARLLEDRTPEEALAVLQRVRDAGVGPLTPAELDSQVEATLAGKSMGTGKKPA